MLPNLQRLRVFHQVYESKSLRDAAKVLNVTQSAASQQLAKLESELGSQLFVRLHKQLVPTPAANVLALTVGRFLREVEGNLESIRRGRELPAGLLRVGAPTEFGSQRLVDQIATFRRNYPDVRFRVTLGHPDQLLPMVETGELDLAFTDVFERAPRGGGLALAPVMEEELILVASGRYHRSLDERHAFEPLSRASFVCYSPRAEAVRHWFRHHFRREPGSLFIALSVQSVVAVVAGVKADLGLGVVPAAPIASELRTRRLVEISGRAPRIKNQIALARLEDKRPTAAEKLFVRFVCRQPAD